LKGNIHLSPVREEEKFAYGKVEEGDRKRGAADGKKGAAFA